MELARLRETLAEKQKRQPAGVASANSFSLPAESNMAWNRETDPDLNLFVRKFFDLALANGARTADIAEPGARKLSTREMGDAVLAALDKVASDVKERV